MYENQNLSPRARAPVGHPEEVLLAGLELGEARLAGALARRVLRAHGARDGILERAVEASGRPGQRAVGVRDKRRHVQVRVLRRLELACICGPRRVFLEFVPLGFCVGKPPK